MKIVIRDYQPSDLAACRSLWEELTLRHRELYEDPAIGGGNPGLAFDLYLARADRRGAWVAEVGDKIIGLAGLLAHGEEGEIEPVIVSSVYRRRGIGSLLVRHGVQEARKTGVRFLSVKPVARNKEAIHFFASLGFLTVGHIDLLQDLAHAPDRRWKTGIQIHDEELYY